MNIKIRHQKRVFDEDGDECYAITSFPSRHRATILMSRQLNQYVHTYVATLIHELIHVWSFRLCQFGFVFHADEKKADRLEHKFVYAAERAVLKEFKKIHKIGRK